MRPGEALRVQAAVAKAWAEGQAEWLKGLAAAREILFTRPHGEQPEPQPASTVGACRWCERVPCEDGVHALWGAGKTSSDT